MIEGYLDNQWSDWLGGMDVAHDDEGRTLLAGSILDQSTHTESLRKSVTSV